MSFAERPLEIRFYETEEEAAAAALTKQQANNLDTFRAVKVKDGWAVERQIVAPYWSLERE